MARMDEYAQNNFYWADQDEIQEMYQFLWGECYLYIDSLLTCEEKDAKAEASSIVEFITGFFEMLSKWLKLLPSLMDYCTYMKKYPYLYLVCPEAAILNLHKSFITSLELIFGYSPRSEDFMRVSSLMLEKSNSLPATKTRKTHSVSIFL